MTSPIATYTVEVALAPNTTEAGVTALIDFLSHNNPDMESGLHDAMMEALGDLPDDLFDRVTVAVRET